MRRVYAAGAFQDDQLAFSVRRRLGLQDRVDGAFAPGTRLVGS
jgi:hypothetical protein